MIKILNHLRRKIWVLPILIVLSGSICAADPTELDNALFNGDYERAYQLIVPLAESGDKIAQFNLGQMYQNGRWVEKDYFKALYWLEKSLQQGDSSAYYQIAALYFTGHKSFARDYNKAAKWLKKTANSGKRGMQLAARLLGWMHEHGSGLPLDYDESLKWYLKGAHSGNKIAMKNVSRFYRKGIGTPVDLVLTHMWLSLGSNDWLPKSEDLVSLEQIMTAEQITEAIKKAKDHKAKNKQ